MFDLKKPCSNCPFRREGGIRLRPGRIAEINHGFFPCHKTTTHDDNDDEGGVLFTGKEQFCAGRLILAVKEEALDQLMRIGLRTGWNPDAMQETEAVFDTVEEMVEAQVQAEAEELRPKSKKRKTAKPGWSRWYRDARAEMEFRYGLRGIPVDAYKEKFFLGCTVHQGVRDIAKATRSGRARP